LLKEILYNADEIVLSRAYGCAKFKWITVWQEGKKDPDFIIDGKKETSVFFFIWTQYEREIRHAMMSCFDTPEACHEVHDAVYSMEDIDTSHIEAEVLESTGFSIKISKD